MSRRWPRRCWRPQRLTASTAPRSASSRCRLWQPALRRKTRRSRGRCRQRREARRLRQTIKKEFLELCDPGSQRSSFQTRRMQELADILDSTEHPPGTSASSVGHRRKEEEEVVEEVTAQLLFMVSWVFLVEYKTVGFFREMISGCVSVSFPRGYCACVSHGGFCGNFTFCSSWRWTGPRILRSILVAWGVLKIVFSHILRIVGVCLVTRFLREGGLGVHTWKSGHHTSLVHLAALVRCPWCLRCTLPGSTVHTVRASVFAVSCSVFVLPEEYIELSDRHWIQFLRQRARIHRFPT